MQTSNHTLPKSKPVYQKVWHHKPHLFGVWMDTFVYGLKADFLAK
jgi:hypothetical protein